jgi:putative ABC transport system permease protein
LVLAARNIRNHTRRSLAGLVAIAFGVTALMLEEGFVEWTFWAMREYTIHYGMGHLRISRAGFRDAGAKDIDRYLLPLNSVEEHVLNRFDGVDKVAPRLSLSGLVSREGATLSFVGEGMDPSRESNLVNESLIIAGKTLSGDDPKGIIMGDGLAKNLGAKLGDTVVLLANTSSGGINAVEGNIRGLFHTLSKAYDDSALRLNLRLAQELVRTNGTHELVVYLKSTDRTEEVLNGLRRDAAMRQDEVTPWYDLADFYNKTVRLYTKQVAVMKLIIGIIIVLGVSNTLMTSVMERTGEIGTMMALGTTRARVRRRFLMESALLGALGGVIGLLLGVILAHVISKIGIPMPPPPGHSHGYIGGIIITPGVMIDAIVLALVTTVLAGVLPAVKASRLPIVDALRANR